MTYCPFSLEERKMIVSARERNRYILTLPEPRRSFAILGVPEDQWPRYEDWVQRTIEAIATDRASEDYGNDPDAR